MNLGKYIVRLHWLGSWRKIYVDDKLPLDKDNNILLPGFKFVKQEGLDKVPSNLEKSADVKSNSSKKDKKSSKSSKGSKGKKAGNNILLNVIRLINNLNLTVP